MQILGCSKDAITIIADTLFGIYGKIEIDLIKNLPSEESFDEQPIKINTFLHNQYEYKKLEAFLGVTGPTSKKLVYEFFKKNYKIDIEHYVNLFHKTTIMPACLKLGKGIKIGPQCVIAPFVEIKDFVTLNRNISIGHDTTIGEFTTINPGVNIAGKCKIGQNVTIGIGTTVFNDIVIGDNSIIGGGSLVIKSIPPNVIAWGHPTQQKKRINDKLLPGNG